MELRALGIRGEAVDNDRTANQNGTRLAHAQRRQRGTYALEFALIFPIFFALFYGVLSFGLIFTVQQSLTLAAEDGARASLRYFQPAAAGAASIEQQFLGRLAHGCDVAKARAAWLGEIGGKTVEPSCSAAIQGPCRSADGTIDASQKCSVVLGAAGGASSVACGDTQAEQCSVTMAVSYAYGTNPLVPSLPGTTLLVPDTLQASASVTLDPGVLRLADVGGGA